MTRNALQNWRLSRIQLKLKEEEEEESGSSEPHHQVNANYNRKQGEKISNIRLFSPPQILTIQTHTQLKKQKTRMPMAKNSLQSHILSQIHFKFQKHKKKKIKKEEKRQKNSRALRLKWKKRRTWPPTTATEGRASQREEKALLSAPP